MKRNLRCLTLHLILGIKKRMDWANRLLHAQGKSEIHNFDPKT